jgi:hypothetical protein
MSAGRLSRPLRSRIPPGAAGGEELAGGVAALLGAPGEVVQQALVAEIGDGVVALGGRQLAGQRVGGHNRGAGTHAADGGTAGGVADQGDPAA